MSSKSLLHSFVALIFIVCILTLFASAQQKPVISSRIDDSVRATFAGSRHPLAQAQFDVGSVDPTTRLDRMLLVLDATTDQQQALQKLLDSQQDPTSPNYHHWLTPKEFGQKFGPAPQDVQSVSAWLQSRGFTVTSVAHSGRWIEFSGSAGQAERAFGTVLRQYSVANEHHIANATDISVPTAIAPVTRGVVSLHNFFKKPMLTHYMQAKANVDGTYTAINPDATFNTSNGPVHALTPGDYAKIYQFGPLLSAALNGTGVTIAIVARSDANISDFTGFRQITNLPAASLINTLTQPPDPGFDPNNGDSVEVNLDSQWAGAVAPGAAINVVVSASTATTDGVDLSSAYVVDNNLAPVMSVSFGDCESNLSPSENAFFNSLWQQAAAEGISVMVSSGDSGAAGCDFAEQPRPATGGLAVSGLASTPFNTAVGGTEFAESGHDATFWAASNGTGGVSALGYIPEVAWNESCDPNTVNSPCAGIGLFILASSGGGRSGIYSKPSWQSSVSGIPSDQVRDVPDISLSAASHDGYVICFNFSCNGGLVGIVGGTSASSPSFAGLMAIVNQAAGRQGLANYMLYELARKPNAFCDSASRAVPSLPPPSTCLFNDVIFGSNTVPGQSGFAANAGFDLATGLGSVNAANLVNAWKAIALNGTTLAISSNGGASISAAHGTAVPLLATVTGQTATGNPSGAVALIHSNGSALGSLFLSPSGANSAQFNGTIGNLPGGTYTLTGHYPGDGIFAPGNSSGISVAITPEASTTTLRTFAVNSFGAPIATNTFPYGSFMDIHADIAGASGQGTATGNVTFTEVGAPQGLGTSPVNLKGESELLMFGGNSFPFALTVGSHNLTASYGGDNSFNASNAATFAVTITKATPNVDAGFFSDQSFFATVPGRLDGIVRPTGNILPTGSVQYLDGGTVLGGPVTIVAGSDQAPLSVTFNSQGTHPITASYSGDTIYNPAVSPVFNVNVVAPFFVGGIVNTATVAAGKSTSFNLNVGPSTNTVTFNGTVALSCTSSNPAVTCSVTPGSIAVTPTAGGSITVNVSAATNAGLRGRPLLRWPMALAGVVAVVLCGFSRKSRQPLFAALAFCLVLGATSCGGGGNPQPIPTPVPTPPPNTQAKLVVTGTSGSYSSSWTVNLTVTH
jgi:hypothetical protein